MKPRPFDLPKQLVDLLKPGAKAEMLRAVRMLEALQRLQLVIRSGGKVSAGAIQITGGSSLLSAVANLASEDVSPPEVIISVTSQVTGFAITVSTSNLHPGEFTVGWNNPGASGGANLYYVAGDGLQNTGPAFFTRGPGSTGGPLVQSGIARAWILVFVSNNSVDQSHWIRVPPRYP